MTVSIYNLKPAFIALLRPLASILAKIGITANQVTATACLLSILYAALLLCYPASPLLWGLLPVWLFIRMALNAIDGILAREFDQKSRLGAILNEMGDVLADAALFIPLLMVPGVSFCAVAIFIWMALLTEFAGVVALLVHSPRRYDGPCGKSDRAFLIGLAGLLIAGICLWNLPIAPVISWGLYCASALMIWTTIDRLRNALTGGASGPFCTSLLLPCMHFLSWPGLLAVTYSPMILPQNRKSSLALKRGAGYCFFYSPYSLPPSPGHKYSSVLSVFLPSKNLSRSLQPEIRTDGLFSGLMSPFLCNTPGLVLAGMACSSFLSQYTSFSFCLAAWCSRVTPKVFCAPQQHCIGA